jgi:hypothetical protein
VQRLGPAAACRAQADLQAPGLEVRCVRARGQLAVAALGGDPGLEVELPGRRGTELVHRDVDDAVRDLQLAQDLLLDRQDPLVLGGRGRRLDEAEHLDLVELVHPEDPARVAARGARLAAEAGREAGVAARERLRVEDLRGVQRRERHLARAHEVEVVLRQPVDLLLGVGQEARAVQGLLADQHRRDHRLEAVAP